LLLCILQNLTAKSYKEDPVGTYGTPNVDWPILETYREGQVLDIKLGVRAYHWVRKKIRCFGPTSAGGSGREQ